MLSFDTPRPFYFSAYVVWTGTSITPLFWCLFAMEYTGIDLRDRSKLLAAIIPVGSVLLGWTNWYHQLVWSNTANEALYIGWRHFGTQGVVFWIYSFYAYVLIGAGTFLLFRLSYRSDRLYRDQVVLLVLGVAAAIVPNVISLAGYGYDLETYALPITLGCFSYVIFRQNLLRVAPATRTIGQRRAVADLEDGLVITDDDDQVVYVNDAAADILSCDRSALRGEALYEFLGEDQVDFETDDALAQLTFEERVYEVRSSPVLDQRDNEIGRTLLLSDVTAREARERELRRQRDELETVNRINRLIREMNKSLVESTTREEIEDAVVTTLSNSDLYSSAQVESGLLDWKEGDLSEPIRGSRENDGPVLSRENYALDGGGVPVDDLPTAGDGRGGGGAQRWTVVPISYRETVYGTLVLATDRHDAFGEREFAILDELGEVIGYAINSVERRRLQLADTVIELEFRCTDEASCLVQLAEDSHCTLDLAGIVPDGRGEFTAYYSLSGLSTEDIEDTVVDHPAVDTHRVVEETGEDVVVEFAHTDRALLYPLIEAGAVIDAVRSDDEACHVAATVAPDTDVRQFVKRVERDFPDTELIAKREQNRAGGDTPALRDDVVESLTERQQEVLEAAYNAGYFEWPRESDAKDVAETLDITSPTLHYHLRQSQDRILEEVLAADE